MPTPEQVEASGPSTAMASSGAAAAGSGEGATGGFFRDRDPPPPYNGEGPETSFALWERNVKLREFETDIPRNKRGVTLLRVLTGSVRVAVEEIAFEDVACEDGVRNLVTRLREYYMPHLEVSLPRAFEAAVYGQRKQTKESFGEYIAKLDKAFSRLKKEGVDLPESAQGCILYRQSSLSESQDQRFLVWSDGKYDRASVVKALRKLDKVIKERGKSTYIMDIPEYEAVNLLAEEDDSWLEDPGCDDGSFVYIQEGDLADILDEGDVMTALASYREVRQALKDQKKGRGYYGKGSFGNNFQKGKGKGGRWQKVHAEQFKLRSRCWRCSGSLEPRVSE